MSKLHKAKIIEYKPDALEYFENAIDAFEADDCLNAAYLCGKAIENDRLCLEYQFFLNDIYIKAGLYFNAIKVNLELLSFEEVIPEAYYNIAHCYFLMSDYENAFNFIKRGIELGADDIDEGTITREMIEKIDREKRFYLFDLENEHRAIVNMAEDLLGAGEYEAAEQLLNFVPKNSKIYLTALSDTAQCQLRSGKYQTALKTVEKVLQKEPENIYALCCRVQVYSALKQNEKLNETVIRIKQKDTLTSSDILRICLVFLETGMHSEALHFLNKFRAMKAYDESALFLQGIAYYNCGFTAKAQANMLSLLKLDSSNVLAKYYNKYFQDNPVKAGGVSLSYMPHLPLEEQDALMEKITRYSDSFDLDVYLSRKSNLDEILWMLKSRRTDEYSDILYKFYASKNEGFLELMTKSLVDREVPVSAKKYILKLQLSYGYTKNTAITIDDNLKYIDCSLPAKFNKKHKRFQRIWIEVFSLYAGLTEDFEEKFRDEFDGVEEAFSKCVDFETEDSAVCAYFAHTLGGHKLLKSIQSVCDMFNADKTQVQRLKAAVSYIRKPKKRVQKRKSELDKILEELDFQDTSF